MTPATLRAGLGPDLAGCGPESQRAVAYRYHRRNHSASLEIAQQRLPALGALPAAIFARQQLLLAVGPRADHNQGAEPVVFEPNVEVHSVDPHINVLAPGQIASAKGRMLLLPAGGQSGDVGRRQTGRVLAQQAFQRGAKIAGGEPAQIQDGQHLGHLGRTPHVTRQDAARVAPAASLLILPAIVDPRRLKLHGSRAQGKLAPLAPAVAHHQRTSLLVALAALALDVIVGLRLKRFAQHPPCALARDLVQRQKPLTGFPCILLLDYLQHRWRLLPTRLPPGFALHTRKVTPPFSCRHRSTTFGNSSRPRGGRSSIPLSESSIAGADSFGLPYATQQTGYPLLEFFPENRAVE